MKKFYLFYLLLTGCGFTPLYGTHNPTYKILQDTQIIINPIPNEYGAEMHRILTDQIPTLTQNPKHKYVLSVDAPTFSGYDKTITNDEFASTIQATGRVSYTLKEDKTNKILQQKHLSSVSTYTVNINPYATTVAKNKVYKDLSEQLAQQIGMNVMAFISKDTQ